VDADGVLRLARVDWIEHVAAALLVLLGDGTVVAVNGVACRLLDRAETGPAPLAGLVGEAAATAICRLLPTAGPQPGLAAPVTAETGRGALPLLAAASRLPGDSDVWLVTLAGDKAAPSWRDHLVEILDELPVGVEIYDGEVRELFSNIQSTAMFGYAPGELAIDDWWETAYPDPNERATVRSLWDEGFRASRNGDQVYGREVREVRCRDGSRKIVEFRLRSIGAHVVLVHWDVTAQHRMEEELRRLADTDALTGLMNRRRFLDAAEEALAASRAAGAPLSLVIFDLDYFKRVNDRHGHAAGDEVLRVVAARCRVALGADVPIGRTGGEEFAVLLPNAARAAAVVAARHLQRAIASAPIEAGAARLSVGASFGVACANAADSVDSLFERTDQALYAAKRAGRGCVRFGGGPSADDGA